MNLRKARSTRRIRGRNKRERKKGRNNYCKKKTGRGTEEGQGGTEMKREEEGEGYCPSGSSRLFPGTLGLVAAALGHAVVRRGLSPSTPTPCFRELGRLALRRCHLCLRFGFQRRLPKTRMLDAHPVDLDVAQFLAEVGQRAAFFKSAFGLQH